MSSLRLGFEQSAVDELGEVDPSEYYFRTAVTFQAGGEKYRWLNRLLAVGVGTRTAAGMVTEVFAIR